MRSGVLHRLLVLLGCAVVGADAGCAERDPFTANDVAPKPSCEWGATVTTLAAPVEPAVATAPRPVRLQETVSLGYAGDGPLTQIQTRREWWGDHDRAGYGGYGGYRYGYGGRGAGRGTPSYGPQVSSGQAGSGPPFQQSTGTRGGGHASPAAPPPAAPPAAHGPR